MRHAGFPGGGFGGGQAGGVPGGMGGLLNGSRPTAQQIAAWVADHFTATTLGAATVYDLTASTATT